MPIDDFGAVDDGASEHLVAMMHATDAWPAVRSLRSWVLAGTDVGPATLVVDVGSGPGTFSRRADVRGATTIDVDPSAAMLGALRAARPRARVVRASLEALPFRPFTGDVVVRAERVLQWTDDAHAALESLWALVPRRGWCAVTDTDWTSCNVEHPEPGVRVAVAQAAANWVRHPRLAADLPRLLARFGPRRLEHRRDTVVIDRWDPDDPAQRSGPPGLPLRSIAPGEPAAVDAIAAAARRGRFRASLDLVTVLARR